MSTGWGALGVPCLRAGCLCLGPAGASGRSCPPSSRRAGATQSQHIWAGDIMSARAPWGPAQLQEPGWGSQIPVGWVPGGFSKVGWIGEGSDELLPPEGATQHWTTGHQRALDSESAQPWHVNAEGLGAAASPWKLWEGSSNKTSRPLSEQGGGAAGTCIRGGGVSGDQVPGPGLSPRGICSPAPVTGPLCVPILQMRKWGL